MCSLVFFSLTLLNFIFLVLKYDSYIIINRKKYAPQPDSNILFYHVLFCLFFIHNILLAKILIKY
ncbi:hypothetical protein VCHA50P415_10149 [Vibrio chagasii]|nr:hypothetical protein VCHA34O109_10052 [Vibrio chagasii]CAH6969599.1 hypothetical protein VCHA50P415_10149 [Vibrio chagasii]